MDQKPKNRCWTMLLKKTVVPSGRVYMKGKDITRTSEEALCTVRPISTVVFVNN